MDHRPWAGIGARWPVSLAAVWSLLAPSPGVAQEAPELLLLDIEAGGYVLAEAVPAYAWRDTHVVDFALFLAAVEFPIERGEQLWTGWFRSEDRVFTWRTGSGYVYAADTEGVPVAPDEWLIDAEGAVHVAIDALERWFDLVLSVDPRSQTLTVDSSDPLPFQAWREQTLAKYRYRAGQQIDVEVVVPDRYAWATVPLFSFSTHANVQRTEQERGHAQTATLGGAMDLLKHSVVYSGATSRSSTPAVVPESTNRLTIARDSATRDTPLLWGVHSYRLGDVYQSSSNLVMGPERGRGFTIDRYPEGRTGSLGGVTIADNGPPGWEAELYRNGTLIEFATLGPDGRYSFSNQETLFGENVFVVKLFGPQGQTREDRHVFWGGGIELERDDYDFSISHIDFSNELLGGTRGNVEGLAASYATDLRYERALTDDLQLGAALTRTGLGTRERDGTFLDKEYLSIFGRMRFGSGVFVGELVDQIDAGGALSVEYLTGRNGHDIRVAHRLFDDYESPSTIRRDALEGLTEVTVSGTFGGALKSAYRLGVKHQDRAGGPSDITLFNRLATRFGPVSLSNDLEYIVAPGADPTLGRLRLASRFKRVSLRGQLAYSLTGKQRLKQVSATLNWDVAGRWNYNVTVAKQLTNNEELLLTNLLSLRIRDFDLTFSASSNLNDTWSVGAGFNIAFGYDERRASFLTDNRDLPSYGRATMNLFIDENNNGLREPGEPPVRWASYRDDEMLATAPGVLPLTPLPDAREVQIETRHLRFDDPFLVPRAQAYELRTHAGADIDVDVAVVLTGDIEGRVFFGSPDDAVAARRVVVSLRTPSGREIDTTFSEFDGFYSFTGVPGGEYEVHVSSDEHDAKRVVPVTLDARDGYAVVEGIYITE